MILLTFHLFTKRKKIWGHDKRLKYLSQCRIDCAVCRSEFVVGQADRVKVWSGNTWSQTWIWLTLQHRLAQIHTGRASDCFLCVRVCFSLTCVCVHCTDIPCPVVSPLCVWVAVASSRQASWRWCLQVSGVQQVLLWWCHRVASRGRLPGCSQVASSLAGRPWWDGRTPDVPEHKGVHI